MLQWTEASASWSNVSMMATCEHASSTLFSTHLKLMGRGAEPKEPGRYGLGNHGLMAPEDPGAEATSPEATLPKMPAPALSVLVTPCRAPQAPRTSIANVTVGHRWMTETNKA
jgi:hypothetical protein